MRNPVYKKWAELYLNSLEKSMRVTKIPARDKNRMQQPWISVMNKLNRTSLNDGEVAMEIARKCAAPHQTGIQVMCKLFSIGRKFWEQEQYNKETNAKDPIEVVASTYVKDPEFGAEFAQAKKLMKIWKLFWATNYKKLDEVKEKKRINKLVMMDMLRDTSDAAETPQRIFESRVQSIFEMGWPQMNVTDVRFKGVSLSSYEPFSHNLFVRAAAWYKVGTMQPRSPDDEVFGVSTFPLLITDYLCMMASRMGYENKEMGRYILPAFTCDKSAQHIAEDVTNSKRKRRKSSTKK
ncbi:hypothetical protein AKO1_002196 [Acrasis kona]